MRPVPDCAIPFVKAHEGLVLTAYRCPGDALTIGWGHTGPEVVEGLTISESAAEAYLREDLDIAAKKLARVVSPEVIESLAEGQYAALLSFVFNLGAKPDWTIWKRLNAGQLDLVDEEMKRFVYAAGKRLPGLVKRRADEVALWFSDAPKVASPDVRDEVIPLPSPLPPPKPEKPVETHQSPIKSKTIWGAQICAILAPLVVAVGPAFFQNVLKVDPAGAQEATNAIVTLLCVLGGNVATIGRGSATIKPLG